MLAAIKLDNKITLNAYEICEKGTDGMLPPEFIRCQSSVTQMVP